MTNLQSFPSTTILQVAIMQDQVHRAKQADRIEDAKTELDQLNRQLDVLLERSFQTARDAPAS
jgi:hypothetical protein